MTETELTISELILRRPVEIVNYLDTFDHADDLREYVKLRKHRLCEALLPSITLFNAIGRAQHANTISQFLNPDARNRYLVWLAIGSLDLVALDVSLVSIDRADPNHVLEQAIYSLMLNISPFGHFYFSQANVYIPVKNKLRQFYNDVFDKFIRHAPMLDNMWMAHLRYLNGKVYGNVHPYELTYRILKNDVELRIPGIIDHYYKQYANDRTFMDAMDHAVVHYEQEWNAESRREDLDTNTRHLPIHIIEVALIAESMFYNKFASIFAMTIGLRPTTGQRQSPIIHPDELRLIELVIRYGLPHTINSFLCLRHLHLLPDNAFKLLQLNKHAPSDMLALVKTLVSNGATSDEDRATRSPWSPNDYASFVSALSVAKEIGHNPFDLPSNSSQ